LSFVRPGLNPLCDAYRGFPRFARSRPGYIPSSLRDSEPLANDSTLGAAPTITDATGGLVSIAGDGQTITFTPAAGFTGSTSFNYTVADNFGATSTAPVYVTVTNTAPTATNYDVFVHAGNAATLSPDLTTDTPTVDKATVTPSCYPHAPEELP
jgi:hypothetical protein